MSQTNQGTLTVTNILLLVNLMIFAAMRLSPELQQSGFGLFYPQNPRFELWQFVTYSFMHASVLHLLLNMLALWAFGHLLERALGQWRYLMFYLVTAVGAAVVYALINRFYFANAVEAVMQAGVSADRLHAVLLSDRYMPGIPASETAAKIFVSPMVGASGAIYGILAGLVWLGPRLQQPLAFLPKALSFRQLLLFVLFLELVLGVVSTLLLGSGVAHFAHIGGALVASLLMVFWGRNYVAAKVDS